MRNSGKKRHAEIGGAGIAGLATAAALSKRGWSVTVHERAPTLRTFGAGIYIWSNGLRVLKALGAYDQATKNAHVGPVMEMRDHNNRVVESIPINRPGSPRLITILRETLISSLVNVCLSNGVEIRTDSQTTGANAEGILYLADGSERTADLVVGADGINSRVRDSLDLVLYRRDIAYGAVRTIIERKRTDLPETDIEKYIEHFSGSRRFLYTPVNKRDLYVAFCCAANDEAAMASPPDQDVWTRSFPHLEPIITRLGEAGRWDSFEFVKLRKWSRGRAAVLGDAAHAMSPFLGQGGGCALMNAIGLAAAVADAPDIAQALEDWERRERPITEHTQEMSERLADMNYWPDDLRSKVMRIVGASPEIAAERMKTAMHVPTATESDQ
jgi:2-polyprenyl-6-methoxyphenol hydroxylase-like FAD-dependent oxidoreductase